MDRRVLIAGIALLGTSLSGSGATPVSAQPRVVDLSVRGGKLAGGARVVRVQQGDAVVLRWTTDRALTIHLHGYDIERTLSPGAPTDMPLTARATGRFPIEVHGSGSGHGAILVYLEVHPR